jgi:hypothetical protein
MGRNSEVEPVHDHGLDIDEKLKDHILGWKVQTGGIIFIFLIVLSAALGLYGDGILSKRTISSLGNIIAYDYFTRLENRMPLKVMVAPTPPDRAVISFSNHYLEKFRIEAIVPEPSDVNVSEANIHYTFKSKGDFTVVFYLVPQDFGSVEGTLSINDHSLKINHFIFP